MGESVVFMYCAYMEYPFKLDKVDWPFESI